MAVGVEIDLWQILKDLSSTVSKLKDRSAQAQINTLLAQLTASLSEKERRIFELETANRELTAIKQLDFPDGHNYVIDPQHPPRKLCPVCSMKNKVPTPLNQANGWCQVCGKYYK